ncbi:MAG: hypothetical protein R2698_03780 [Microthrixaceae bacterium]
MTPSADPTDPVADPGPGASTPDAMLRAASDNLIEVVERVLDRWARWSVGRRVEITEELAPRVDEVAIRCRDETVERLRTLLAEPVEAQRTTPLDVLRDACRYPTSLLRSLGVTEVPRDPFDREHRPEDRYDLAIGTWSDLGEEMAERGLEWGAAKAFAVLRARTPE